MATFAVTAAVAPPLRGNWRYGQAGQAFGQSYCLAQRRLQNGQLVSQTQSFCPGIKRAIARDFIALDYLRRSGQSGIQDGTIAVFRDDLGTFIHVAVDSDTDLCTGILVKSIKDLLKPFSLSLSFRTMDGERLSLVRRLSRTFHLGQHFQDLTLGIINIFKRFKK